MGPNLRRLFEYKRLTGLKRELKDCATYFKRKQLFDTHGEALIAALDKLQDECLASDFNEHWKSYTDARQLLAQLEAEAQP